LIVTLRAARDPIHLTGDYKPQTELPRHFANQIHHTSTENVARNRNRQVKKLCNRSLLSLRHVGN
jgi:hypothetical protein